MLFYSNMSNAKEGFIIHPTLKDLGYPATEQRVHVENWHGQELSDNYAWLDGDGSYVRGWEAAQNQLTRRYLDSLDYRAEIKDKLKKWSDLDQIGTPFPRGDKLFQWKRKAGENHYVLYVGRELDHQEVVIDPNTMSEDGTTAIDWTSITRDGKYLTYGVSEGGSEQSVLRIRDVDTKEELPDVIPNTRHSSVSWLPDNSGFYYTRLPEPGTVPPGEEHYDRKVFFHKLGSNWPEDKLIFAPKDPHDDHPAVILSQDGQWAKLSVSHGWNSNDVYVAKVEGDPTSPEFKPLAVGEDNHFYVTEFNGFFYIMTDHKAPKYKIMRVSCDTPDLSDKSKWEEFIPEQESTLDDFRIIGGKAVLGYQVKACSRLELMDLVSGDRQEIQLPTLGTVTAITGEEDQPELHYSFESYAVPDSIYKLDTQTGAQKKVDGLKVDVDLSGIATEQVTYNSKDGTPITMFVVKSKDTQNNGSNKTILYGYGGFNISETPVFSGSIVEWVNSGGVYVTTNLRGGSEYGEEWHRAGMLDKKQNVFDDFIAAAEYLIDNKYTQPEKLAIWGGSNGGLLVGATMVQRPELFGAVVCQVPLLDMIHYDRLKIAKLWRSEYGDPANPEHFSFLHAYSPYHHVVDGTAYPSVFFQTAENDSRVDAMHARKMAARLQAATSSDKPVLLYVEDKAGHGAGKPVAKILEDSTDVYTFLRSTIGD